MMRSARRTSLLVAFYLLTSVATTYAECAWVLWEQSALFRTTAAPSDLSSSFHWEPRDAFEAREACQRALTAEQERVKASQKAAMEKSEASGRPAAVVPLRVVCLPDTIDPRGPKGK